MLSSANYKANESNWQHYPESNQANKHQCSHSSNAIAVPRKQYTPHINLTQTTSSPQPKAITIYMNQKEANPKSPANQSTKHQQSVAQISTYNKSSQPKTQSHVQSTNHNEHTVVLTKHTNIQSIHGNKQTSTTKGNNNLHHKVT
eukprot:gene13131-8977_t